MDISKLVRNADKVLGSLKELPNNSLVATKRLRIYIPVRFKDRNLAVISSEIHICGIYAIVTEDNFYAVSRVNAMVGLKPSVINTIKIDEEAYYEFTFEPGAVVIPNLNLVKDDTMTYYIFEEFFAKGNVPWYLSYEDLGSIYDTSVKHAGANFGKNREVIELIASIITRNEKDKYTQYRYILKDKLDVKDKKPAYVALDSIQYTATNTLAKMAGAYMGDGVVSALVNPGERVERIESLLTK